MLCLGQWVKAAAWKAGWSFPIGWKERKESELLVFHTVSQNLSLQNRKTGLGDLDLRNLKHFPAKSSV